MVFLRAAEHHSITPCDFSSLHANTVQGGFQYCSRFYLRSRKHLAFKMVVYVGHSFQSGVPSLSCHVNDTVSHMYWPLSKTFTYCTLNSQLESWNVQCNLTYIHTCISFPNLIWHVSKIPGGAVNSCTHYLSRWRSLDLIIFLDTLSPSNTGISVQKTTSRCMITSRWVGTAKQFVPFTHTTTTPLVEGQLWFTTTQTQTMISLTPIHLLLDSRLLTEL